MFIAQNWIATNERTVVSSSFVPRLGLKLSELGYIRTRRSCQFRLFSISKTFSEIEPLSACFSRTCTILFNHQKSSKIVSGASSISVELHLLSTLLNYPLCPYTPVPLSSVSTPSAFVCSTGSPSCKNFALLNIYSDFRH